MLDGHAVVPGGGGAVGVDHPPPRHRTAVGGHHAPGRDRVHHVEHAAGEVVDRRRAAVVSGPRHWFARPWARRSTASRVPAAAISASEVSARSENKTSWPEPRGRTGAG